MKHACTVPFGVFVYAANIKYLKVTFITLQVNVFMSLTKCAVTNFAMTLTLGLLIKQWLSEAVKNVD